MNTIVFAIPSHDRHDRIVTHTLHMLEKYAVPQSAIHVFVTPGQEGRYTHSIHKTMPHVHVHRGKRGLKHQRNYIASYFPIGTCVVNIDDDVKNIMVLQPGGTLSPLGTSFMRWCHEMFAIMNKYKVTLGGVGAVKNPYFMKNTITFDLRFVVGAFWMCVATRDPPTITMDEKEDVERTIKHYLRDGCVMRNNACAVDTQYFQSSSRSSTSGGMQSARTDRAAAAKKSAELLAARYPDLGRVETKKSGWVEFRLKRVAKKHSDIRPRTKTVG